MNNKICNFCGQPDFETKKVEYIYRHRQRYMLFRDVPTEICLHCGMRYFAANIVLEIERRFFEIQQQKSLPGHTITVPVENFAPATQ